VDLEKKIKHYDGRFFWQCLALFYDEHSLFIYNDRTMFQELTIHEDLRNNRFQHPTLSAGTLVCETCSVISCIPFRRCPYQLDRPYED
jgi:hypothetical protein